MWLSKYHEMSVGPLWVLRERSPDAALPATQVCSHCAAPWLLSVPRQTDLLVVLPSGVSDQAQLLLQNCLQAAGWRDVAALFSLHLPCANSAEAGLLALQNQLGTSPVATIVVFGADAAQRLDPTFVRGQIYSYQNARLIVTHDPQQMLDTPALKAQVWSDLCLVLREA